MNHWKYILLLVLTAISANACALTQTAYGAPVGVFYQDTTINHVFPKSTDLGSRSGTACIKSYMGVYSKGDAGISAAAASGGITTIRAVDYKIQNIFFFYMKTCTIAYGD